MIQRTSISSDKLKNTFSWESEKNIITQLKKLYRSKNFLKISIH